MLTFKKLSLDEKVETFVDKLNYNIDLLIMNGGGIKGDKGDRGEPGIPGARGRAGRVGATGTTGADGNSWIVGDTYPVAEDIPDLTDKDYYMDSSTSTIYHYVNGVFQDKGRLLMSASSGSTNLKTFIPTTDSRISIVANRSTDTSILLSDIGSIDGLDYISKIGDDYTTSTTVQGGLQKGYASYPLKIYSSLDNHDGSVLTTTGTRHGKHIHLANSTAMLSNAYFKVKSGFLIDSDWDGETTETLVFKGLKSESPDGHTQNIKFTADGITFDGDTTLNVVKFNPLSSTLTTDVPAIRWNSTLARFEWNSGDETTNWNAWSGGSGGSSSDHDFASVVIYDEDGIKDVGFLAGQDSAKLNFLQGDGITLDIETDGSTKLIKITNANSSSTSVPYYGAQYRFRQGDGYHIDPGVSPIPIVLDGGTSELLSFYPTPYGTSTMADGDVIVEENGVPTFKVKPSEAGYYQVNMTILGMQSFVTYGIIEPADFGVALFKNDTPAKWFGAISPTPISLSRAFKYLSPSEWLTSTDSSSFVHEMHASTVIYVDGVNDEFYVGIKSFEQESRTFIYLSGYIDFHLIGV